MRASSYDQSKPTMVLNFSSETLPERFIKHVIAHEFGHALGLGHEHQSSDFWNVVKRFMDTEKMKSDLGLSGRYCFFSIYFPFFAQQFHPLCFSAYPFCSLHLLCSYSVKIACGQTFYSSSAGSEAASLAESALSRVPGLIGSLSFLTLLFSSMYTYRPISDSHDRRCFRK